MALVESPTTPLVLAGEIGRQRVVWLGFDTLESTWPLRISFPIFIANAVDWLNPANARAAQFQVHPGDPIRLALTSPLTNAVMRLPENQRAVLILAHYEQMPLAEIAHTLVERQPAEWRQRSECSPFGLTRK